MKPGAGVNRSVVRLALIAGGVVLGLVTVLGHSASADAFAGTATVNKHVDFLGDAAGKLLTFSVKNTGTSTRIYAVEVTPPDAKWNVLLCKAAPSGWTVTTSGQTCVFETSSAPITPSHLLGGFVERVATLPGDADDDGQWQVAVSSTTTPDPPTTQAAGPLRNGALAAHIRSYELTNAVVADAAATAGDACPADNKTAPAGSHKAIVICGRNHTTATHTMGAGSTLGGTFVQTPGTLSAGPVGPTSGTNRVVLASWTNTLITSNVGSGKTVVASVASDATHTSPVDKLTGYQTTVGNTAPVASNQSVSTDEDTPLLITLSASDAEDNDLTFTTGSAAHGMVSAVSSTDCSAVNTCTAQVTYRPASNFNGADSFTFKANDGALDSNTATVSITVNAVNDAPVGVADSYETVGNTRLYVGGGGSGPHIDASGSVLDNDTDVDTPSGLTATAGSISSTNCVSCNNVTMNADGTFLYDPPPGFTGADTFNYTVNDNDTGDAPSPAQSGVGTVTVNVEGPVIWYVDSTPGSLTGNSGRSHSPFTSISSLAPSDGSVDASGDIIFVYSGTYSAAGGLPLQSDQSLWGEPHGLAVDPTGSLPLTTLVAAGGTNPALSTTSPSTAGITLASGVDVERVDASGSSCSSCDGVAGTGITTATMGANTAISANTGRGVVLSGAAGGTIDIASAISGNTGNAVSVQNRSSGTITFSGPVSTTAAAGGVSLASNTGGAVAFTGGLNLSTTTGSAFSATGGGTVTATQDNSTIVNALASTTATALNVANTTIGAGGLTFRSISANGAADGIVLNTTGAFGGLTVSGNGGACTSDTTCTGGAIENTSGDGVALTNTLSPTFDRLFVGSTGGSGVLGSGVTNFGFTHGVVDNAGDGASESAIAFNGLGNAIAGTVTITNNTLSSPFYSGVDIQADAGTVSQADISSNTISDPGQNGISIVGTGTATTAFSLTKATLDSNSITGAGFDGIQVAVGNANASGPGGTAGIYNDATNKVAITGNAISLDATGAQVIAVATSSTNNTSRSQMNFDISGNGTAGTPLLGSNAGTALLVGNNGYSDMSGTISNNVINANQTANGGGANGIGGGNGVAGAGNAWTPQLKLTVSGNAITNTDGNGILLVGRGTSGHADLAITNNNVAAPINSGGTARQGIRVDAGNAASNDDSVCLAISGNTSAGSNGAQGIGIRKQGTVSGVNSFGIVGLTPSPATAAQAASYVSSQNAGGGGTDVVAGDNFVSCTQ